MTRWAGLALAMAGLFLAGCEFPGKPAPPAEAIPAANWVPVTSTAFRIQVQSLGQVPNSGLLLPAVSPDGRYVAYLELKLGQAPEADSLLTGVGLAETSLHVRKVQPEDRPVVLCQAGASWMSWSAGGEAIAYVVAGSQGGCELGTYEPATGRTLRVATRLRRAAMPTLAPSGQKIALVEVGTLPEEAAIRIVDLPGGEARPGPACQKGEKQLWPLWLSEEILLYMGWQGERCFLYQWSKDTPQPRAICEMPVPRTLAESLQVFLGIGRPVHADGRQIAYYDLAKDCIVLQSIGSGGAQPLETASRSGCWLGPGQFALATEQDLKAATTDGKPPVRILRGAWLPLWADARTGEFILCGRSKNEERFDVARLRLLPSR